ncbi:MAG TPA: EAL domain-containing protein [Polyangiaceae bacterium]|nr:EAL domain-containing protein [Polyangiaceae bacterium]
MTESKWKMPRQRRSTTIGVLTPYAGGFYYGAILAAIHATARARGATVVALHTFGMDLFWPDEPGSEPLALNVADGWIAINEFDSARFASRVVAAGKPLVYLSERPEGLKCCSVLPHNREGAKAATRHLIEHGHRNIAFAGFLGQFDLRERYEGYLDAHREAGIEADPSLLFFSHNNLEIDGHDVGRKIVEARLPCTALVAGTDKTALGLIPVLRDAGYDIPADFAIVGFDDIEKAQYADPPLSTVRQRFDLLGATAAETLLDCLLDDVALPDVVRVPTAFIRRASCGCVANASLSPPKVDAATSDRADALAHALLQVASTRNLTELSPSAWPGARRIAEHLHALAEGEKPLTPDELSGAWDGLLNMSRDVESVEGAIAVIEAFANAWCAALPPPGAGATDAARRRVQVAVRQLRIELMRQWRVTEQVRSRYYDLVSEANAKINVALAGKDFANAKSLSWLRWTRLRYGALGLWSKGGEGSARQLSIISEYGAEHLPVTLRDTSYVASQFPPPAARELIAELGDENMLMMVPIKGPDRNRGLLTVIGPVEVELLDHVGSVHEWAALVGASLEREDVEAQLRDHALRDSLTGLPNRALLLERLEWLLASTKRSEGQRFAVLFLDLDDFKSINDSLGHLAGDRLLVDIAQRLQSCLGDADIIARLGGDEFSVIVPSVVHDGDALDVAKRIHEALRAPFTLDGDPVFTSCSTGIVFSTSHHESAADLLRDADTAMYRAKLQGRARSAVFDSDMHAQAKERLRLDSTLRQALERNEFELHYQPLISLRSNRPIGAEALIRWNHPERGRLAPARFLSVAEEVGLAIPISKWVLETACREAALWRSLGGEPLYVNVNVPPQHFKDPQFVELIESLLERYQLPASALGLELVESSLIEQQQATIQVLEQLQRLGVKTAIDDFGTGYSSLSYLKLFPLSVLKLDRGFIQGIPDDPHDTAITSAIITMAHGLGLTVVAEGVESPAQAKFLRSQGCDVLQGFLLSRPLPAKECRRFLSSGGQPELVLRATA